MNDFFAPLISSVAGLAGGWVMFLFKRKKLSAEINKLKAEKNKLDLENVGEVIALWQSIATDLTAEVKSLKNEMSELKQENASLKKELHALNTRLKSYENEFN